MTDAASPTNQVIGGLVMSLDGYINDADGNVGRLYPDFEATRNDPDLLESIRTTGAVVMGRRAYDMAQGDFTGYEFQTPIFVVTQHAPSQVALGENENLRFHFVLDGLASAIEQAKAAAGHKNVTVVGGASTLRQCIQSRLLDELHLDIRSILLGGGQRLFDTFPAVIELETIAVSQSPNVTHLRFRIVKAT